MSDVFTYSIEPVVDQMLEILAHSDLSHQFVLVAVHASELAHMREYVLQPVRQLERVYVIQAVLDVRVHDQFCEAEDLAAQVES